MKKRLKEVRDWAQGKIDSRQEPPWAWYQYMKLIETCDAILAGQSVVTQTASSQQSEPPQGNVIPLTDSKSRRGAAQRRQDNETPQMPM